MPTPAEVAAEIGVSLTPPPVLAPVTGRIETADDLAAALVRLGISADTARKLKASGFSALI
jgi:hypothetical protein